MNIPKLKLQIKKAIKPQLCLSFAISKKALLEKTNYQVLKDIEIRSKQKDFKFIEEKMPEEVHIWDLTAKGAFGDIPTWIPMIACDFLAPKKKAALGLWLSSKALNALKGNVPKNGTKKAIARIIKTNIKTLDRPWRMYTLTDKDIEKCENLLNSHPWEPTIPDLVLLSQYAGPTNLINGASNLVTLLPMASSALAYAETEMYAGAKFLNAKNNIEHKLLKELCDITVINHKPISSAGP